MVEWNQTAKTGSREKAIAAWVKRGRPKFGASWKRWEHSAEWKEPWHNFPHVVTWINDGRVDQDPSESKTKPAAPADARCAFHRAYGTLGKKPPAGWFADCPECKHARAGSGTRTSEPVSAAAALDKKLAELRQAGERRATPEQIRQLRGEREPRSPALGPPSASTAGGVTIAAPPGRSSADGAGTASGDLAGCSATGGER